MSNAVVVGGGIGGMLATSILRDQGHDVTLVDPSPRLGGLLASVDHGGLIFDQGTHLPQETGVAELDDLLFAGIDPSEWRIHHVQRAGNVFASRLDERTVFPDVNRLQPALAEQAHRELLAATMATSAPESADAYSDLTSTFGPTVRDHVIGPVVERLLGAELSSLEAAVHRLFVGRVVAFTPERTRALKQDAAHDAILSFHDAAEGANTRCSFYPRVGGAGRWIEDLTDRLVGNAHRRQAAVTKVDVDDGRVGAVLLDDGALIECDLLVWTLPASLLARLADFDVSVPSGPPTLVPVELHHIAFDRPFLTDRFYVPCFDADTDVFRTTIYPNLRMDDGAGGHTCTIEVLRGDDDGSGPVSTVSLINDLIAFGIVDGGARVQGAWTDVVKAGFPRRTPEAATATCEIADEVESEMTNIRVVGRGSGRSFFMADVLKEVHQRVSALS